MNKKRITVCLMMLYIVHTQAQEKITIEMPRLRLGIETGVDFSFGEINKPEMIRENQYYYQDGDYDFHCGFVFTNSNFGFLYFGVKPEYLLNKHFTVTAGLRFFTNKAMLHSDRDYFLWKVREDKINTDYIKIKSISQRNYYLGVPLEIRYFPNEKDYFARFYLVAGTTFGFLLASDNEIVFSNPAMEKYTPQVMEHIGKPNSFYGTFYTGAGIKLGKLDHICGRIEMHIPTFTYVNMNNELNLFTRIDPVSFGFQATLLIPIYTEHKLTYTIDN